MFKYLLSIAAIFSYLNGCSADSLNITSDASIRDGEENDGEGFEEGASPTPITGASLLTYDNAATACSVASQSGQSTTTCVAMAGDEIALGLEEGLSISWGDPIDQNTGAAPSGFSCATSELNITQICSFPTPMFQFTLDYSLNLVKTNSNGTKSKTITGAVSDEVLYLNRSAAGLEFACHLLTNDSLKCWGSGVTGEIGQGSTEIMGDQPNEMGSNLAPVDLGSGFTAIQVGANHIHACALLNDHSVKCWGSNLKGELGQGNTTTIGDGAGEMGDNLSAIDLGSSRKAKTVSVGYSSTCVILDNDELKCWGDNAFGQLGLGNTVVIGDGAGEMGDNLVAVDLGTGKKAKSVVTAFRSTCAILNDNSLKCWGRNSNGEMGQGNTSHIGDGPGEMGDNLSPIDLGTGKTALTVTIGDGHICALLNDFSVKCWGENSLGQLGQGNTVIIGDGPGEMGDNLPAIDLGTGRTAMQISAGETHTCAVLDNYAVKCWGTEANESLAEGDLGGQMGDNLAAVDLGTGKTAKFVFMGAYSSCAVLNDGGVKCWGGNVSGQLGQGNTNNLEIFNPAHMGDNLPAIDL